MSVSAAPGEALRLEDGALPASELAPKVTEPAGIKGASQALKLKAWPEIKYDRAKEQHSYSEGLIPLLDDAVKAVYP